MWMNVKMTQMDRYVYAVCCIRDRGSNLYVEMRVVEMF